MYKKNLNGIVDIIADDVFTNYLSVSGNTDISSNLYTNTFVNQPIGYFTDVSYNIQQQLNNLLGVQNTLSNNLLNIIDPSGVLNIVPNTISVGGVTNLPYGSTPYVTNTGTTTDAVFSFGLVSGPQGIQGYMGSKGETGSTGLTGFTGATGQQGLQGYMGLTGNTGLTGSTGPKGDKGDRGNDGADGTIDGSGISPQDLASLIVEVGAMTGLTAVLEAQILELLGFQTTQQAYDAVNTATTTALQTTSTALQTTAIAVEDSVASLTTQIGNIFNSGYTWLGEVGDPIEAGYSPFHQNVADIPDFIRL